MRRILQDLAEASSNVLTHGETFVGDLFRGSQAIAATVILRKHGVARI